MGQFVPLLYSGAEIWRVMTVNRLMFLSASAALLVAGLAKMATQAASQSVVLIPTCLGGSVEVPLEGASTPWLHCWGCYAALAGSAGLTLLLAQQIHRKREAVRIRLS